MLLIAHETQVVLLLSTLKFNPFFMFLALLHHCYIDYLTLKLICHIVISIHEKTSGFWLIIVTWSKVQMTGAQIYVRANIRDSLGWGEVRMRNGKRRLMPFPTLYIMWIFYYSFRFPFACQSRVFI